MLPMFPGSVVGLPKAIHSISHGLKAIDSDTKFVKSRQLAPRAWVERLICAEPSNSIKVVAVLRAASHPASCAGGGISIRVG